MLRKISNQKLKEFNVTQIFKAKTSGFIVFYTRDFIVSSILHRFQQSILPRPIRVTRIFCIPKKRVADGRSHENLLSRKISTQNVAGTE